MLLPLQTPMIRSWPAQRRAAEVYNAFCGARCRSVWGGAAPPVAYAEQLTVGGAMCTIDIPKIGVYLPVRHGTGAETLERTVGHVVGTSLPVGGAGSHAVLSAHSGMARRSCLQTLTSW